MPNITSLATLAELFAAGLLLIVCCSHVIAPRAWSRLFQDALQYPGAGLIIGLVTLTTGLPILIVHWRWTGDLRSIVTVMAWGWTLKGTLYLLWPGALSLVGARHVKHPQRFVAAGLAGIALAVLALVGTFRAGQW